MGACKPRFKREECERTKHDSDFSKWQILIGASDWEDYSLGKEGAARYRLHNLPTRSGPGLYELGIAVSHTGLGREVATLDPDRIVVVYLGQAMDVRTRLQEYGRSGAHLGNNYSTDQSNDYKVLSCQKGLGLFEEIFSRGYPIVFRWASMKDKRDAEKTEAQLLETFDYAWNKGSNGPRRPDDVLQKLQELASDTIQLPSIARKLLTFGQKQVGIRIKARKPVLQENGSSSFINEENNNFLSRVFKFGRSQPRLISEKSHVGDVEFGIFNDQEFSGHDVQNFSNSAINLQNELILPICGVILDGGTPCRRPPVPGRKRCGQHKGRRVYGSICKSAAEDKSINGEDAYFESTTHIDWYRNAMCGVEFSNGNFCTKQPVAGRKRCEEHKGMRVNSLVSKLAAQV